MIFLLALIPATGLTVAGYVALFLSHRSEGTLRTFGRYLGIWAFVLAGLVVLGGVFAAGHMRRMHPMWGPHPGMTRPWMDWRREDDRMDKRERETPGGAPEGSPAAPPAGQAGSPPPPPPPGR